MTDNLNPDEIRADMEAGTDGPWQFRGPWEDHRTFDTPAHKEAQP